MKFKTIIINAEIIEKYGYNAAILLHHIAYWTEFNKRSKQEKAKKDGVYWTYQTQDEIASQYPGMSKNIVKNTMTLLGKAKLIIKKPFFVNGKTPNHYRLTDVGRRYSAVFTWRNKRLLVDYDKMDKYGEDEKVLSGGDKSVSAGSADTSALYINNKTQKSNSDLKVGRAVPADHIVAILDAFVPITVKVNYGNKAEREAAAELIDRVGFEQALFFAKKAVESTQLRIKGDQYSLSITSPTELNRKFAKLADQLSKPLKAASQMPESWRSILDD